MIKWVVLGDGKKFEASTPSWKRRVLTLHRPRVWVVSTWWGIFQWAASSKADDSHSSNSQRASPQEARWTLPKRIDLSRPVESPTEIRTVGCNNKVESYKSMERRNWNQGTEWAAAATRPEHSLPSCTSPVEHPKHKTALAHRPRPMSFCPSLWRSSSHPGQSTPLIHRSAVASHQLFRENKHSGSRFYYFCIACGMGKRDYTHLAVEPAQLLHHHYHGGRGRHIPTAQVQQLQTQVCSDCLWTSSCEGYGERLLCSSSWCV